MVFWVVTCVLCCCRWIMFQKNMLSSFPHFNPDDGGNMFFWNISVHLQYYMVSQPRRPQFEHHENLKIHIVVWCKMSCQLVLESRLYFRELWMWSQMIRFTGGSHIVLCAWIISLLCTIMIGFTVAVIVSDLFSSCSVLLWHECILINCQHWRACRLLMNTVLQCISLHI
jgi:hypothetical protein